MTSFWCLYFWLSTVNAGCEVNDTKKGKILFSNNVVKIFILDVWQSSKYASDDFSAVSYFHKK